MRADVISRRHLLPKLLVATRFCHAEAVAESVAGYSLSCRATPGGQGLLAEFDSKRSFGAFGFDAISDDPRPLSDARRASTHAITRAQLSA